MIGRVGKVLRLQAESVTVVVYLVPLPLNRAIEEISAIELDAWFGAQHLKNTAAFWLVSFGHQLWRPRTMIIQHPVVVVTFTKL